MSQADDRLSGLYAALEFVVMERSGPNEFVFIADVPAWFRQGFSENVERRANLRLDGLSPFLDDFLLGADLVWQQGAKDRHLSGPWMHINADGMEWPLEAIALRQDGASLLLLRHLGEDYAREVSVLQDARNNLLRKEALETEVRKRMAQIRQREEELAMRLLAAAGFRDKETGAHVRRIGQYSIVIGRSLGWSGTRLGDIAIAAPMHDIGKIGIPDQILLKPNRLNLAECGVMRRHTVIGHEMLSGSDIALLQMAAKIAHEHHERWDGAGYPRRLRGDEIDVTARIVAIVDVYDALVHRRVYKPAVEESKALKYLRAQAGRHFDPVLVEIFMDNLDEMRRIRQETPEEEQRRVPEPSVPAAHASRFPG